MTAVGSKIGMGLCRNIVFIQSLSAVGIKLLIIPVDDAFCLSIDLAEKSVWLPEASSYFSYIKAPVVHREDTGSSVPIITL